MKYELKMGFINEEIEKYLEVIAKIMSETRMSPKGTVVVA
jgi:hypothetical protein